MTLTEQWKKGELINGKKYYITFFDSEPFEATFRAFEAIIPYWKFEANGKQYCDENGYDCVKVLAPVPSYQEWQKVLNIDFNNEVLILENTKLKELLKECREASLEYGNHSENYELYDRIDNAIGEKK